MRILLIDPPYQRLEKVFNPYFPLGIAYVASMLEKNGHFVRIYNADKGREEKAFITTSDKESHITAHENLVQAVINPKHYVWAEVRQRIEQFQPDVIGIHAMTSTFPSARVVARIAKEINAKVPVIVGGVHPTTVPDEVMADRNIDFAVRGEGEMTTLELVDALQQGSKDFSHIDGICYRENGAIKWSPPRKLIKDLDTLPFPARHLVLDPELYTNEFASLIMGRGCPFQCTFCGSKVMWTRKPRSRSPANVVAEMKYVKENYEVRSFDFQDDTLTFNKKRLLELCQLLINAKLNIHWTSYSRVDVITQDILPILKKSGCYMLNFGIESGSERMLRIMKKQIKLDQVLRAREILKKYDIEFVALFMIGTPEETKEDLMATINFLKELRPDSVNVCTYTPYPGTEMYERAVELGVVAKDLDRIYFSHHSTSNMFSKFMMPEEFVKLRTELLKVADLMTNRINLAYIMSKLKLLRRDRRYFISRIPHYIATFPRHLMKSLTRHHQVMNEFVSKILRYGKVKSKDCNRSISEGISENHDAD